MLKPLQINLDCLIAQLRSHPTPYLCYLSPSSPLCPTPWSFLASC